MIKRNSTDLPKMNILSYFNEDVNVNTICSRLNEGLKDIAVSGLWGGSRALFILALQKKVKGQVVVISEREDFADAQIEDIRAFIPEESKLRLEMFYQDRPLESLKSLFSLYAYPDNNSILFTTIASIQARIISKNKYAEQSFDINRGQQIDYNVFLEKLLSAGYTRADMVTQPGEFSVRGQVIDLWTANFTGPVRMVLLNDKIEQIKRFDITTQKSTVEEQIVHIIPASFDAGSGEKGMLIFDWLGDNPVVVLDGISSSSIFGGMNTREEFSRRSSLPVTLIEMSALPVKNSINYGTFQQSSFNADVKAFFAQLLLWKSEGMSVHIFCNNSGEKSRLADLLEETSAGQSIPVPEISLNTGSLNAGFIWPAKKLVVLTDTEVFNRYKIKRHWQKFSYENTKFTELSELNIGDYMVHERYGIGIFTGLKQVQVEGRGADYVVLEYTNNDLLYVPVEDFMLVQKYIGDEGYRPRLNSLDSTSWLQAKRNARKSVRNIARELLNVHAARQSVPGHSFPADSEFEKKFAEAFIYELTPSQKKAVDEVLYDMMDKRPMDRIVCGDVGYGKTEVAMRASFKAVLDGKQVAVLVPTTILAEQHFNTFSERFADYPVNIQMLSRFRTGRQQKDILDSLKNGRMDIVIGTHRLLQKDVCFSDIGLIIIDEEHKFGVRHKEKIKQLKKLIDVLTLTATPIPRTLSMAMGGVRCLSVIDTPPPERLPIETYVGEYDDDTVRVAISNEVNRGGQVFYIHDRIDTIDSTVSSLMSMVPGINICYIHGQMPARKIEKIMQDFIAKKYSILVSTTIVESGLDIPSVNTIIISNAQKLGLAQMHQLRGRIGRDKYQAFCYFLYPQEELLTDIARKRLMTIAQHTDLGAGFKIALKDLQIRGAGNLLGSQQHGHIMNVGFDLYCKLLGQAVEEMRCGIDIEEDVETVHTIEINLPVDAYIPVTYISSPVQRIMTYKRLSSASEMKTIEGLAEELVDRYGNMPMQCRILLEIVKIRQLSKQLGVMHISHKAGRVTIRFSNNEILKPEKFSRINMEDNVTIQLEAGKELNIVIDNIFSSGLEDVKKIKNILKVLI